MALIWESKDPDEVLDYEILWAPRLVNDTIASSSWTVPAGLTQSTPSFTATATKLWLAGGTMGASYDILNRITTAAGRTMDQTVKIKIRAK